MDSTSDKDKDSLAEHIRNGCEDVDDLVPQENESELLHVLQRIIRQEFHAFSTSLLLHLQAKQETLAKEFSLFKEESLANHHCMLKVLDTVHINQEAANRLLRRATNSEEISVNNTDDQHEGRQHNNNGIADGSAVAPSSKVCSEAEDEGVKLVEKQREEEWWAELEGRGGHADDTNLYKALIVQRLNKFGFWERALDRFGLRSIIRTQRPESLLARIVEGTPFNFATMILILLNTSIMGYEANVAIQTVLKESRAGLPEWLPTVQRTLNMIFAAELLIRMSAFRSWFFMCPDWAWNMIDLFLVFMSVSADFFHTTNVSFLRSLRAIRAFRSIRVLRVFRELRRMLLAMLSCFSTLAWCFLFFWFIVFMFAVLFIEGLAQALQTMPASEFESARDEVKQWYADLSRAMLSLFAAATGGMDWMDIRAPLEHAGEAYTTAFLVYIIFFVIGMMNVLTGIFVSSADESADFPLAVENERRRVETFVSDMLELFQEFNIAHTEALDWNGFSEFMQNHDVQAYLAGHGLQTTHVHLVFELLVDETNTVRIDQLILGFLKLKSEAKALDAKIIRREVANLRPFLTKSLPRDTTRNPPREDLFTPILPNV